MEFGRGKIGSLKVLRRFWKGGRVNVSGWELKSKFLVGRSWNLKNMGVKFLDFCAFKVHDGYH